jgi:aminoacyl tRNA synthase complex-interacting multifunctional protein 1
VSGLVNYIPIEQMRDKYLVGVVCSNSPSLPPAMSDCYETVQPEAGEHARREELRHGPLCGSLAARSPKTGLTLAQATSKDGKDAGIELIQPPPGSKPGDRVYFEGPAFEAATPLSQLNPKKKIFETIQPGFTTLDGREAAWVDPASKAVHRIRTERGVCVAPTLVGASLS